MRRPPAAFVIAVLLAAPGADATAQVSGVIDLGATWIDYEGFLGSAATFVTPTVRFDAATLSVGASGTLLVFESGSSVMQGLLAGSWRARVLPGVHGELAASAGVNAYSQAPSYGHGLVAARAHAGGARQGVWAGATTGRTSRSGGAITPVAFEFGGWTVLGDFSLRGTATRTWLDNTAFADLVAFGRWNGESIRIEGSLGTRLLSGGGAGTYGELQIMIPLADRFAAVVAGGRYPTDPVRGVLAANYVSTAVRITALRARRTTVWSGTSSRTRSPTLARGEAHLAVLDRSGLTRLLRVIAPGAERVELAGDFTDWVAVPLRSAADGAWEVALPLVAGIYRVAVRVNGGPWIVPTGLRAEESEFGETVGVLVVP